MKMKMKTDAKFMCLVWIYSDKESYFLYIVWLFQCCFHTKHKHVHPTHRHCNVKSQRGDRMIINEVICRTLKNCNRNNCRGG